MAAVVSFMISAVMIDPDSGAPMGFILGMDPEADAAGGSLRGASFFGNDPNPAETPTSALAGGAGAGGWGVVTVDAGSGGVTAASGLGMDPDPVASAFSFSNRLGGFGSAPISGRGFPHRAHLLRADRL